MIYYQKRTKRGNVDSAGKNFVAMLLAMTLLYYQGLGLRAERIKANNDKAGKDLLYAAFVGRFSRL